MNNYFKDIKRLERDKKILESEIAEIDEEIDLLQAKCNHEIVLITRKATYQQGFDLYKHEDTECLFCKKKNIRIDTTERNKHRVIDISGYRDEEYSSSISDTNKKVDEIREIYSNVSKYNNDEESLIELIMEIETRDYNANNKKSKTKSKKYLKK